jgi:hypothetical protein
VKDASGHYAMWIDENGVSKDEFFIALDMAGSVTQPAKFHTSQLHNQGRKDFIFSQFIYLPAKRQFH